MDNYFPNQPQGFAPPNQAQSNLTPYTLQNLKQSDTWMGVISVVLFILTALTFIMGIFLLAAGSKMKTFGLKGATAGVGLIYIILGVLFYLIPGVLLLIHATRLSNFSFTNSFVDLDDAIMKGKSFWTYTGVLTLIVTILFFIVIILTIAAAS